MFTLLTGLSAFSFTSKDSISAFTFQRMALMEDFDCDACGCSASGGSMGFSSMLNNNFVGLRYFRQSYTSRDGIFANSPWIDENFNTVQAWARIPVTEKVQISALVPYHFPERNQAWPAPHAGGRAPRPGSRPPPRARSDCVSPRAWRLRAMRAPTARSIAFSSTMVTLISIPS